MEVTFKGDLKGEFETACQAEETVGSEIGKRLMYLSH